MSIQKCIKSVKSEKMEQYIGKGDINDVNMELIKVTNKLIKKQNGSIHIPKILYYYNKKKEFYDSEDSDCPLNSDSDSDSSEYDETVLTFEFPCYGHLIKNVNMVQKNNKNIIRCQMKTKHTKQILFDSAWKEPIGSVEIVRGDDLIPIVNLLNDTIIVNLWVSTNRKLYDYELTHDVYFFNDLTLKEIRNTNNFEYNQHTYTTDKGKLKNEN